MPFGLQSYIRRSLNLDACRHGSKVRASRPDVLADIHDGLRIMLGPDYRRRIEDAMDSGTFQGSEEQRFLAAAINSATSAPERHRKQTALGVRDPEARREDRIQRLVEMAEMLTAPLNRLADQERELLVSHYIDGKSFSALSAEAKLAFS
jgi:hypothetical protein